MSPVKRFGICNLHQSMVGFRVDEHFVHIIYGEKEIFIIRSLYNYLYEPI